MGSVVQTEDVFRRANEEIADLARKQGWRFPVPFLCECADRHCFARLELTLEVYERVRSNRQRYLTAPSLRVNQTLPLSAASASRAAVCELT